ncbi:MAG: hypothetical protein ACPGVN_09325 [Alphaproteobacteria bacterium]
MSMFPTPNDIKRNMVLLFDVFRLKPESTAKFSTDSVGVGQSFALAPFLFPIFFFWIMNYTLTLDDSLSASSIGIRALFLYSTLWTLFPVVLYARGIRNNLRRFVVARNWLLVANMLIMMIASLGAPFTVIGVVVGLYLNVVTWFIIKDSFSLTNGKTFLWFFVEVFLNSSIMLYYFISVGIDFEKYIENVTAAANAANGG